MMRTEEKLFEWELGKLVHELDLKNGAWLRDRIAVLGLTTAQASAMRELTEPMTLRELATRMSCEPSNATVVIDKLEALGLIERSAHPTDRRAKQLAVTPTGSEMRERLLALLEGEPSMCSLSQADAAALYHLLRRALA